MNPMKKENKILNVLTLTFIERNSGWGLNNNIIPLPHYHLGLEGMSTVSFFLEETSSSRKVFARQFR